MPIKHEQMLEINVVVKIELFLVVINLCHEQVLEINEVVKIKQFLVVIHLCLIRTRKNARN